MGAVGEHACMHVRIHAHTHTVTVKRSESYSGNVGDAVLKKRSEVCG